MVARWCLDRADLCISRSAGETATNCLFICEFQQRVGVTWLAELAIASQVLAYESGANFIGKLAVSAFLDVVRMHEPILE
jgi:hypothetical protein